MKRYLRLLKCLPLIFLFSCQQAGSDKQATNSNQEFSINSTAILENFTTWYTYTYYNIRLAQDFIGLDFEAKPLSKIEFLNQLATGNYVPFKTRLQASVPVYQLFKAKTLDQGIQSTIKQMAEIEKVNFAMEGQELPAYSLVDLAGKRYTNVSTRGRVTVFKCWYIGCVACVEEFPEVNKLVDHYQGHHDIQFVSLAFDPADKLKAFLLQHKFNYAVVADQKKYLQEQLHVNGYPTHILVDRAGKIVKVTNTAADLRPFVAKQAAIGIVAR